MSLHLVHIIFGLFGALFVLLSGFDTAGRTALTKGTAMMLVFMATITWTWWVNRQGTPYWPLERVKKRCGYGMREYMGYKGKI